MALDITKFLPRFLTEAKDHLNRINEGLVELENDPECGGEVLNDIFRSAHTIKGSSRMLKLHPISDLAHSLEDVLDSLRGKKIVLSKELLDLIFHGVDALADMVKDTEAGETIEAPDRELIERLTDSAQGKISPKAEPSVAPSPENSPPPDDSSLGNSEWGDVSEVLPIFWEETQEQLKKISEFLVDLEKNTSDSDLLDSIFRIAHTIKGSAKMLNLTSINDLSHRLEDLLDALRTKKIHPAKEFVDLIFQGFDEISRMVSCLADETPLPQPDKKLMDLLEKAASTTQNEIPMSKLSEKKVKKNLTAETIRISSDKLDELINLTGEIISEQNRLRHRAAFVLELEKLSRNLVTDLCQLGNLDFSQQTAETSPEKLKAKLIAGSQALFVQIKQLSRDIRNDVNFQEILTNEIQEKTLRMRMFPLATIFNTFHRTVRDLSRSMGKIIDFSFEGENTELDKKIIEKLDGLLLHMIRNSIDHGIEYPEDRAKAGKAEYGILRLSSYYEGGNVVIEVSDDGAGISAEKIRKSAISKGVIGVEEAQALPDAEILQLIFHPGFSTIEIITDVSGRGVGMDVVRTIIVEELKGSIQTETKLGHGTTFFIRLPLTLAIMRVLLITFSEMTFAISSNFVSEILKVPEKVLIDVVDRKAIRLRNQLIPVVNPSELIGLPEKKRSGDQDILILIVRMGNEYLGLIIDTLVDEEDMVIKPLPPHMKNIQWVAGVLISGKGEIINVLHIPKMFEASKEIKTLRNYGREAKRNAGDVHILVVDDSINTREIEKSILDSYGYQVTVAEDGIEAMEKVRENKFDLIITDVEMPRMDGFTLTETLKKNKDFKEIPVILLTSRDKDEDKRRGIQVGANAYIIKGTFEQSSLLDTILSLTG